MRGGNNFGSRKFNPYRKYFPINPRGDGISGNGFATFDTATFVANTQLCYQLVWVEQPITIDAIMTVWQTDPGGASKNFYTTIYSADPVTFAPTAVIAAQTTTNLTTAGSAITAAVATAGGNGQRILQPHTAGGNHFGYAALAIGGGVRTLQPGPYWIGIAMPQMTGILVCNSGSMGLLHATIDATSATAFAGFTFPAAGAVPQTRTASTFTVQFSDLLTFFRCLRGN